MAVVNQAGKKLLWILALVFFFVILFIWVVSNVWLHGVGRFHYVDLKFVLNPGYSGRLYILEDHSLKLAWGSTYVFEQEGDHVLVPDGFVNAHPPVIFNVIDVRDKNGKVYPPDKIRGMGVSDRGGGKALKWFFTVQK